MGKDLACGITMAVAIALVPNLVQALVQVHGLAGCFGAKLWIIFFVATGTICIAPPAFGVKPPAVSGRRITVGYPALLALAGVMAAAYFLVVLGTRKQPGLGAAVAETLDSSLAPCFYVALVWSLGTVTLSKRALLSSFLVAAGLLVLGLTTSLSPKTGPAAAARTGVPPAESAQPPGEDRFDPTPTGDGTLPVLSPSAPVSALLAGPDRDLLFVGVLGAVGTACSLWLLRRLVRNYKAGLGFAVFFRYGGVALVSLGLALELSVAGDLARVGWRASLGAFIGGGILTSTAFFAAINIRSEAAQAGSLGMVPLFALLFEGLAHAASWSESRVPFGSPGLWLGTSLAAVGIIGLQSDPATKAA